VPRIRFCGLSAVIAFNAAESRHKNMIDSSGVCRATARTVTPFAIGP
jgi:hypothetical protein